MIVIISEFHPQIKNRVFQKYEVQASSLLDAVDKTYTSKKLVPQNLNLSRSKIKGKRKKLLYGEVRNGSIDYSFLALKK